ncbi:conserved exported hypothetical protein [Pseudomonas sp. 8Z]|uniref:DUF1302 domain-containing protein n=1 Tax=Pseudomonas sp. 8Z TaxID=2653166 RepID=UPI0012F4436B|nr:DUF1302 domain-containing protein [Pseudomonas sp. 8Z]VXC79114.1 conserved exported hypothetical protein [Pseudomonas sp. 8Z]
MTIKTTLRWRLAKLPLAVSLASTLAAPAFGVTFNIGEIEGQFDSSLSVGASWSVRGADPDLVGTVNGGNASSSTSDDNRLNFKKGETFSKIFKGIHDLELKYRDTGVFVRGKYWYDFELKDEGRLFKDVSDSNRKEGAQSSGAEILDAFVYHNYTIGDMPGSVRLGKQVVSWGESTFIGNSINSINPIDAAAFRRPGAEIKEGLIPVNMFYVSQSLTDSLSMEAFYQLEWDQTVADNCGTFFSTSDVIADGCDNNLTVPGATTPAAVANLRALQPIAAATGAGFDVEDEGVVVRRGGDRDARDSGQYGFALRWLGDNTEYGAYFMNYHSRTPFFNTKTADAAVLGGLAATAGNLSNPATTAGALCAAFGGFPACAGNPAFAAAAGGLAPAAALGNGEYFLSYPEDIRLYGLSFSTVLPTGTSWSGEVSYRPNAPIQINSTALNTALVNPLTGGASEPTITTSPGAENKGYRRKELTQVQTTLTHFFDQVLGASRLTLVGELGVAYIGGLERRSDLQYGRDSIYGPYSASNNDGFVTSTSWGYRTRAILEYPDVFAGVNLRPSLSWSHDVDGYGPNGLFNEGSKAVSLGLNAEYQNSYTVDLSYTDFFGGDYNTAIDRDFVALSFGVNF